MILRTAEERESDVTKVPVKGLRATKAQLFPPPSTIPDRTRSSVKDMLLGSTALCCYIIQLATADLMHSCFCSSCFPRHQVSLGGIGMLQVLERQHTIYATFKLQLKEILCRSFAFLNIAFLRIIPPAGRLAFRVRQGQWFNKRSSSHSSFYITISNHFLHTKTPAGIKH